MTHKLILLSSFATIAEAELAQNILRANNIPSVLQRGNMGVATQFSGWAGDAKVYVREMDLACAREITPQAE